MRWGHIRISKNPQALKKKKKNPLKQYSLDLSWLATVASLKTIEEPNVCFAFRKPDSYAIKNKKGPYIRCSQ